MPSAMQWTHPIRGTLNGRDIHKTLMITIEKMSYILFGIAVRSFLDKQGACIRTAFLRSEVQRSRSSLHQQSASFDSQACNGRLSSITLSVAVRSAPFSIKYRQTSMWPSWAALWSAVPPLYHKQLVRTHTITSCSTFTSTSTISITNE